jgi:hypothetical protein
VCVQSSRNFISVDFPDPVIEWMSSCNKLTRYGYIGSTDLAFLISSIYHPHVLAATLTV